ncbi:hypothetical protein WG915_07975 [Corynebacterium sp. H128]|uniref:hypothetical protein n=1 Tax=Corynebacterium sp. H128 TaxID=3133427 RepID=UPI00309FBDFF
MDKRTGLALLFAPLVFAAGCSSGPAPIAADPRTVAQISVTGSAEPAAQNSHVASATVRPTSTSKQPAAAMELPEPKAVAEHCQLSRITGELGRPETKSTLAFCDGKWAKLGAQGEHQELFAQWNGSKWEGLKPDGTLPNGSLASCYAPGRIAKLAAPPEIDLLPCPAAQ